MNHELMAVLYEDLSEHVSINEYLLSRLQKAFLQYMDRGRLETHQTLMHLGAAMKILSTLSCPDLKKLRNGS